MQCDLDQQRARQTISNPPELASCGPGSGPAGVVALCFLFLCLISAKETTVPPISAIIPLTIKIAATNIPEKAKPKLMPTVLAVSLTAVWLILRADLIRLLVEISSGIDIDKDVSEFIDSATTITPTTTRITPPISIPAKEEKECWVNSSGPYFNTHLKEYHFPKIENSMTVIVDIEKHFG
jgi:hypothetical protein